jgi:hypothetical protein
MIERAYAYLCFYLSFIRCLDKRRMTTHFRQIMTVHEERKKKEEEIILRERHRHLRFFSF